MAEIHAITGRQVESLDAGWKLALSEPSRWATPHDVVDADWLDAIVPGTVAGALQALDLWSLDTPAPLHDKDVWYRVAIAGQGEYKLRFEGLATFAEIYLDGRLILTSVTMFEPHEVSVLLDGEHRLDIAFRSLRHALDGITGPRARWRTRMIDEPRLRFVRTTLLGHMPGWCPPVDAVGPFRSVLLIKDGPVQARDVDLRASVSGADGLLSISVALGGVTEDLTPVLRCNGCDVSLSPADEESGGHKVWRGTLRIPDVPLWWPHTHGAPELHAVVLEVGNLRIDLGRTGFRTIEIDRGPDGRAFALQVNGVRIFCRGACWTPTDIVTLDGSADTYDRDLKLMQSAGLNMVRVGGTMLYETAVFHKTCDELGILVWQDLMLANFDYPSDAAFADVMTGEIRAVIDRIGASPSLAIVCGGSEVAQQAAMMGLPERTRELPLFEAVIPAILARYSDVAYVSGSPSGGALPFLPDTGPSHYYGVGAYRRPLEDARRADVRFASECLAFANMPEDTMLQAYSLDAEKDSTGWKSRVPRDGGATWDFENVREHYLKALWGVDGAALRKEDPLRWRDLSRAITAEIIERTIDEWRRPASSNAGALVWLWRDLWPGAGWGLLDSDGRPKSAFNALRRASASLRLFMTDEGTNGLHLHLVNDGPVAVQGTLTFRALRDGRTPVVTASRDVAVAPHSGLTLSAFEMLGLFFDAGDCYRFGPAVHDVVHATFGSVEFPQAEALHFIAPPLLITAAPEIDVVLDEDDVGYFLTLQTARTLRYVSIVDVNFISEDNWFHLSCTSTKKIRLSAAPGKSLPGKPSGYIRVLNSVAEIPYGER
jgi:beta-mannosidase